MPRIWSANVRVWLCCFLVLGGCGDGDTGAPLDPEAVPGTVVRFDLSADLRQSSQFYDLPYPNDLRLDGDGRTDHSGFPGQVGSRLLRPILALASERRLSPVTPFAYFRADAALADRNAEDWLEAAPTSPVLLLGIEPGSRDYGRLIPTVASTLPADNFVPEFLLAVATPPGVILAPDSQYAFVLLRSLNDDAGAPLGVPATFAQLRAGEIPSGSRGTAAAEVYAPLWPALRAAGVDLADVAAATVFSTGDVVADLATLTDALRTRYPVTFEDLHIDPDDGAAHARFCELRGHVRVPMFQRGVPPYDRDGRFEYGNDGLPIVQREEVVPITLTLPRSPMPAGGFPLVMYFHGTGGPSDQVVDRGAVREPEGQRTKGEGPAHVLAAHGFATFQAALPLNPERYTGPVGISGRSYLNLTNLGAYPDTFRQSTIEQRLFLDSLGELEVEAEVVAGCALPTTATGDYRVATERIFGMGQSLGGQIVNMVGAVEPRMEAVVPTGSGGYWALTIVTAQIAEGFDSLMLIGNLLGAPLLRDHLHPGLQLVQSTFEPVEPMVYAQRLALDPLPGHPARSIYQPIGIDDPGFPNPIYSAMALASGTQQAGTPLHPALPRALALADRAAVLDYDVSGNGRSLRGDRYTGVVVQFVDDGILDSHHIFAQLDEVKFQYGCFLRSLSDSDVGSVVRPAPLGSACP